MSDIMRPVPFAELLNRIFSELKSNGSIFGLPVSQFYSEGKNRSFSVWGEDCQTPVGPAAGPHTQLAQNIVSSYLAGGRFMELKTVQKLDRLEIAKPCIDAEDEAYNCEWSTEYTLPKAFDEYLKGWMILHLLEGLFNPHVPVGSRSFVFNMSVGYDLEGIKTPPMQEYIENMLNAAAHPKFEQYKAELKQAIQTAPLFELELNQGGLLSRVDAISPVLTQGITISTLHGCPPQEIEAICRYMIDERGINTFVKLNPTLLGYPRVRAILNDTGFDHVCLSEEAFSHDLQMTDAKAMLKRLFALGKEKGVGFGVKLTNTLGTLNQKGRLPEKEMYMSGRALFPLSINLALELSREFNGELPVSYSGGASKQNIKDIFETGIRPITMATELLKPGGYLRLKDCAMELDGSDQWQMNRIDLTKLEALAAKSLNAHFTQKEWRGPEAIHVNKPVPLTDCAVAPCKVACPISQDIPEYVRLAGEGKYAEALEVIYAKNALPSITGHICDHECQFNCTRRDYEGAVNIRELKKISLEKGWQDYKAKWNVPALNESKPSVAVIGAGPAGLSAGYFLARAGHPVTLFEKEQTAGGVVQNIIPKFRIPRETIEHDIQFVQAHGVQIEYGANPQTRIDELKARGFKYICLGVGADKGNSIQIAGDNPNIYKSLEFLRAFNSDSSLHLGKKVVVVGGGNTAMDSARSALRVPGVEKVTVLYRRTEAEMPAHKDEYKLAVADGVAFMFLTTPEQFDTDGTVTARVMALGEPDEQGRRRPVATDKTVALKADALITAVGEQVNRSVLEKMGIPMAENGWPQLAENSCETAVDNVFLLGDANTGPASIVAAIASARKAADAILEREQQSFVPVIAKSKVTQAEVFERKGLIAATLIEPEQITEANKAEFVEQEAQRCLECSYICSKCVDVCPNRANVSLTVPGFNNQVQVVHLDAYCNECGNCAQFCPWDSKPYKDKFTVFSLLEDFHNSSNTGFFIDGEAVLLRANGDVMQLQLNGLRLEDVPEALVDEVALINEIVANHGYLLGAVEL
jgi:putative selenate reductase